MEWGKIKTILIVIFSIVNIFLFVMFFRGVYVSTELDEDVVNSTVQILAQNNIEISAEDVPDNFSNIKICTVENKYNSLQAMLEDVKKVSAKNGVVFFENADTIIDGNTFICVINKVNSSKKVSNPKGYAKKEMKKTGLLDGVNYSVQQVDNYVYFYLKYEDKPFFDSYLRVKATDEGISEIYGHNWLGDVISDGGVAEGVSPAEMLINFATHQSFERKVRIKSVRIGYYIGERSETVRVTAFPVWEIAMEDGSLYYYDMRNGDILNGEKIT